MAPTLRSGLVQACDGLFGVGLWDRQRELLSAVERGPRIHVWCVGRRAGKTTMGALVGLWDCLFRPEADELVRRGETRFSIAVATNLAQARRVIEAARAVVESVPALAELLEAQTDDQLTFLLPNGRRTALRAMPCTSRGSRGWAVSTLVMDEAAHFLDSEGNQAADKVWQALVPSTMQFGSLARVIVCSTPYGDAGFFADLYGRVVKGEIPDAVAAHATTQQVNPTVDSEILAAEAARDPDSFRSEFLAELLSPGNSFVDFDRVELAGAEPASPSAGESWVVGLDPAFAKDAFGVAVVGRSKATLGQLVVGTVAALPPDADFTATLSQVATIADMYRATRIVTDQFSSAAILNFLSRRGLSVKQHAMSATSKTLVYRELRDRLYDHSLELPDLPGLVAEIRRLKTRFSVGSAAVHNPRLAGSHGDMCQALALATYEHRKGANQVQCYSTFPPAGGATIRGAAGTFRGDKYLDEVPGGKRIPPTGFDIVKPTGR